MEPRPKSYDQLCPLAMALDHVGDRWTMLMVRELLGGPVRFSDLTRALPGIASNLLTERLRRLEAGSIISRRSAGAGVVYALTPLGLELRAPLEALGGWGMRAGPIDGSEPETLRGARSAAMGLEAMLRGGDQPRDRLRLELVVDDEPLTVDFGGSEPVVVRYGAPETSDGSASTTMEALATLPMAGPTPATFRAAPGSESATAALAKCVATGLTRLGAVPDLDK